LAKFISHNQPLDLTFHLCSRSRASVYVNARF